MLFGVSNKTVVILILSFRPSYYKKIQKREDKG